MELWFYKAKFLPKQGDGSRPAAVLPDSCGAPTVLRLEENPQTSPDNGVTIATKPRA